MKKPIFILVFILLTATLSGVLFERNPLWKYRFQSPKYPWIGNQIFFEKSDKDLNVFIGSSHTWYDVDTDMLQAEFKDQLSLNFGVNWFGNDTKLVILRDLLEHRRPARIFIEIRMADDRVAHAVFPFLATFHDIRTCIPLSRRSFHSYKKTTWLESRDQTLSMLGFYMVKGIYLQIRQSLGYIPPMDTFFSSSGHYAVNSTMSVDDPAVHISQFDDTTQWRELSKPFQEMIELAEQNKIPLYFLFLPERNEPFPGKLFSGELSRHGRVVILDFAHLYEPRYWCDPGHLNADGSRIFTRQLIASGVFSKTKPVAI